MTVHRPYETAAMQRRAVMLWQSLAFGPLIVDDARHEDPTCTLCGETTLGLDEHQRCLSCLRSL